MKQVVRGVTLIELLVAVAILGILMLVGLPLTSSWIHGAQVSEAKSRLAQGYGLAKALSLRNPTKAQGTTAAASLVVDADNSAMYVCSGAAASCNASAATKVWQTSIATGIAITYQPPTGSAVAMSSLEFSNTGAPSLSATQYTLTKGSQDETVKLR